MSKSQEELKNRLVVSYLAIRRLIGFLGLLLPEVLITGSVLTADCTGVQDSISHYYYTAMSDVFVGFLFAIAAFLIAYKGYNNDRIATNLAGVFALGVAIFPTNMDGDATCAIHTLADNDLRKYIHYTSAALLFLVLAYISLFLFTKSDGPKTKQKKIRNSLYVVCGIVILFSIAVIAMGHFIPFFENYFNKYKLTFWFESLALTAFGLSWIIKGELILKD